jgi:hypothetical protein
VSLTFDVKEGPQFLVNSVEWWGVHAPSISSQVWELTALKPGDVFDRSKVQETLKECGDFAILVVIQALEPNRDRFNFDDYSENSATASGYTRFARNERHSNVARG